MKKYFNSIFIILILLNVICCCLGNYIPKEDTLNTIKELLGNTQVIGKEMIFNPMGFAFTNNPPMDKVAKFKNETWLAINNKIFENEEESIETNPPVIGLSGPYIIQNKEKLDMEKLDEESQREMNNVDDRDYEEDDPATDPVSIIFEALNTYPSTKSTKEFYLYSLFLPPTASVQKIIVQSNGEPIDSDNYRKSTKKVGNKEESVVKKDIDKQDRGFPKCKTLHIFYTFQSQKDKTHYSDLLLIKDTDEKTWESFSVQQEQKVEIVRYDKATYIKDKDPSQQNQPTEPATTAVIDIPSYQDKVMEYFIDNDQLVLFTSTPYELKIRVIIILERVLFPLFNILCEDDWRVDCWETTTSHLTQTSVINMAEKQFLMDCINEIVEADEEIQEKLYGKGKFKNLFEAQKYKFNSPIAPLTRDRDIIIEKKTKPGTFIDPNPLTMGQYYDLFLKRNNKPWCNGKQNTLLCFGRVDPTKIKDSSNKEIKEIIDDIRYGILRYKKSSYISKSGRK